MVHSEPRGLWVDRPWVDLLIGCGGWSAPLLIVSYLLLDNEARRWASVFYGLALVCNYPHYMATVYRAYARRDDRAQYRLFTHYATGLLLLVAGIAHVRPVLLPWLFTIYVMWSPWHYTGQNFGLAMMFLRRAGANASTPERRRLRVAFVASYVMLLAAFNQGGSQDALVLSLGLPRAIALAIEIAAGCVFLVSGVLALSPIAARLDRKTALLPAVTLFVTQACWFVIPIALTWASAAPAPQTRYSSGILAVMHSAQYLWITRHYAQRDAVRRGGAAAAWNNWTYWGTLIVGGVALFLPGPWLASYVGHFDFTSSMLIVTAVVNIHHFMLDGVVWKLRDPRVAQALVNSDTQAPAPTPTRRTALGARGVATGVDAASARTSARVWGRSRAAWITRPVMVCGLLTLAALDQWRYTLAQRDSDRSALETASVLNPYDGAVHIKVATAAIQTGDTISAERALREAIGADPHDLGAYRLLERFLIQSGRYQEAYAHCRLLLDHWPNDLDTLVNAGVLAYRSGDKAAAEAWWTRALARDGSLREVQLYLAELMDDAGRAAEALPHYQRYLELVAEPPRDAGEPVARPEPRQVALVVVKFADALARTGQRNAAASQYDLAARIARQAGLNEIESLAREHARDR